MELLKNNIRFEFKYDGVPVSELEYTRELYEQDSTLKTVYTFAKGLRITNIAKKYENAYEWVNYLENISNEPTGIVSELYDCSVSLPMPHEQGPKWSAYKPSPQEVTMLYSPNGSTWCCEEFASYPQKALDNRYEGQLTPGMSKSVTTSGGRSSEQKAPFFNIHKDGHGYIFAIGWSGQWRLDIERHEDDVTIRSKIEDTNFRLLPGESFRTSSFVVMPYTASVIDSQNTWRRLVREHFSPQERLGDEGQCPLCANVWGGMKSTSTLSRIEAIKKYELPFEYLWMDAGWYGYETKPTPDEFEGDWGCYTGDYIASPLIFPNGLREISRAAHDAGLKFMLWFEPERVPRSTRLAKEHPEFFISLENTDQLLLDLGNDAAFDYCFNMLKNAIEEYEIDCYRQDFNIAPLDFWRKNDTQDRRGITEIMHINGLYTLWDMLLQAFPHLLIDNCASGGRRIDIETLRRSIPMWRSDFQCPANYPEKGSQCHALSFNLWLPYSGTGTGRPYDTYRARSAYSPSLATNYTYSEREAFGTDEQKMEWLKLQLNEYRRVRAYMNENFYPLTQLSENDDVWCAMQYDRASKNDGVIMVFRREASPYDTASFRLHGIDFTSSYEFVDADTDASVIISGDDLAKRGATVSIPTPRSSKIYFYKKV